ncbi:MAG: hypothetical protein H6741_26430 [Alphaproteobacteria bacterium]|nr:hypothetical protein [Alphaproteobacteria bacterium]MCB9796246.1 hypothetical protein [Alphaproteobacteria bacterium]
MSSRRRAPVDAPARLHPAERALGEHLREHASQDSLLSKLALLRAAAHYADPRRFPIPGKGSAEHRFHAGLRGLRRDRLQLLSGNAARKLSDRRWMASQFGELAKLDLSARESVERLAERLRPDLSKRLPKPRDPRRSRFQAPDPQQVDIRAAQMPVVPLVPALTVAGPAADLQVVDDPRTSLLTDPAQRQSFVSAMAAISARYNEIKGAAVVFGDPVTGIRTHSGGWYSRHYEGGAIYHKRPDFTLALYNDTLGVQGIPQRYLALSAHEGPLGFPLTELKDVPHEDGRIALFDDGLMIHRKPWSHAPTYIACWPIIGYWMSVGMAAGEMGFPLEDQQTRQTLGGEPGVWVPFNNGRIYHHPDTGTHRLPWLLSVTWDSHAEQLGFPTSDARPFGQGVWRLQTFEGGAIVFRADTGLQRAVWGPLWELWWTYRGQPGFGGIPGEMQPLPGGHGWSLTCPNWVLMWDGEDKTVITHVESFAIWSSLVLGSGEDPGFPLNNELLHQAAGCHVLRCPGAMILRAQGESPRWISPATFDTWVAWGGREGTLGWPAQDFQRSVFVSALSGQKEPFAAAIFEDAILYDRGSMGVKLLLGPWLAAHSRSLHGLPLTGVEELPQVLGAAARFQRVVIFQAAEGGDEARVIAKELFDRWLALSPIASGLGWPVADDWPVWRGGEQVGQELRCQRGTLYQADGQLGRPLVGIFDEAYRRLGKADSFLGFPTGAPVTRDGGDTTIVPCEQGSLVTGAYLTHAVGMSAEVVAVWQERGFGDGALGRPTHDPLGDPRWAVNYGQPFQGGMVVVNSGQASAAYMRSEVLLRLERLDVYKQTSGESGRDDISLSTVGIGANSQPAQSSLDLGHFGGGTGRDLDEVIFRAPLHAGATWPKSFAALLSPVERDDGGLDGVAAALLDVAQDAVERAAKRAASAAINAYLGAVPPLAWIADYLAGELIEEIVGEVFEWFAELFEDPDDVFDPKLIHFGVFRYDRIDGGGDDDSFSTRGRLFSVSFKQHGAHWSFSLRWELELRS